MTTSVELAEKLRAQLQEELDIAERHVKALRDTLASLERLMSTIPAPVSNRATRTVKPRQAASGTGSRIMTLFAEDDRLWHEREILDQLNARGWAPISSNPLNALRASLTRLIQSGKLERVSPGVYRVARPDVASLSGNGSVPDAEAVMAALADGETAASEDERQRVDA